MPLLHTRISWESVGANASIRGQYGAALISATTVGGVPESSRNAAAASVGRPSATSFSKACEFGSGPVGDRGLVDDQSPDRHGSGCRLERERPSRGLAEHECRL